MTILTNGFVDLFAEDTFVAHKNGRTHGERNGRHAAAAAPPVPDIELLRRCAWEIGETRATEAYAPPGNHVGLATVAPTQGFAHWRVHGAWMEENRARRGGAWDGCRFVLRLYDVSCIEFNGFNAHRIQDHDLPGLCGQFFFKLPRASTWQVAEVGYLLRNGEFIPAARSQAVSFPADAPSRHASQAASLVDTRGRVEEISNVWDQERILRERRQPRLRRPLRTASLAFASLVSGQECGLATFVSELAAGQCAHGHEAHVFVPACEHFRGYQQMAGVHYHSLDVRLDGSPLEMAASFREAAECRLKEFPPFDVIHLHEWMTGMGEPIGAPALIRSLSSTEATRRGGAAADEFSRAIESAERDAVRSAGCVLTPGWLRDRAAGELGLEKTRIHSFPMEGRLANEWETPIDFGQVKTQIGFGPLDRLLVFIGPLEHAAGVDLLLEAIPVVLQRVPNLRVAFIGAGVMYGHLHQRSHQIGVAGAVRVLGHMEGSAVTRLLRSAEALILPSRYRVPQDDAVIDLARRAGRPVVTTHGGPAHLIHHEENGIVTYDNPGSMVWAIDRILSDPGHTERMGQNGLRRHDGTIRWSDVARCYLELCAAQFPQLTEISYS